MAGSPSVDDFKAGTVPDSKKVVVSYDSYDDLEFVNIPEKIYPVQQIMNYPFYKIFGDEKYDKLNGK